MQVTGKDPNQYRLLFEYSGNFESLMKSGINIQSVFGGDCYSATISHQKLAQLKEGAAKIRIISLY